MVENRGSEHMIGSPFDPHHLTDRFIHPSKYPILRLFSHLFDIHLSSIVEMTFFSIFVGVYQRKNVVVDNGP